MSRLRSAWPVLAVMLATVALGYPVALLFGLPLARQRMHDLSNWVTATVAAQPVADVPEGGATLKFDAAPEGGLLVRDGVPLDVPYHQDGDTVRLDAPLARPAVRLGPPLQGPVGDAGLVYRLPAGSDAGAPVYVGGRLLHAGASESHERADGRATTFTFDVASGPVAVGDRVLLAGKDYRVRGQQVTFAQAPPFNADVRRITGDYAVLDASKGIIALASPATQPPRLGSDAVRLAERLAGAVDGHNRAFTFAHAPVLDGDPSRKVYLDGRALSSTPERPRERVDGQRTRFTFASSSGLVTVDGQLMTAGSAYTRDGSTVTFAAPPRRNAEVRQYRDYYVSDMRQGTITLAAPPAPGSVVWAADYTYYARPACGTTVMQCFYSMPQHPVPFPNWIAARVVPYFTHYPITDPRNIVRGVLYTTAGTLSALLLGGAFGVLLAVLFVFLRPLEQALLPWVIASQTVPIIALVPVLLLILGNFGITVQTSLIPTALIGAYIAFFPVTVGTVTGLRSVDPLALDLMKSYAANPVQVFVKVRFPAAVPFLFTSLKLGTAAALVGALVSETESNNRLGLGYDIVGQVQAGNVADLWILLLISAALGIGLVALVGAVQRLTAPWDRP